MNPQIISSGLYRITNNINGKCYIGITKNPILSRWKAHQKLAFKKNSKQAIHCAMRKYGLENFIVETLVINDDKPFLNELEKKAIALYKTKAPNGYNLTDGGDGLCNPTQETLNKIKLGRKLNPPVLTEQGRISLSENTKAYWGDPILHETRSNNIKLAVNQKEIKEKHDKAVKEFSNSDIGKKIKSNAAKENWKNEDYASLISKTVKEAKQKAGFEKNSAATKKGWGTRRKNKL